MRLIDANDLMKAVTYSSCINELEIPNVLDLITNATTIKQCEPFGYLCDWGAKFGSSRFCFYYEERGSALEDDWNEYPKVHCNLPLYTAPPQKQWVGLTDDEIEKMWEFYKGGWYDYTQAIETKLKELNT